MIINRCTVVVIIRNSTGDANQLKERCKKFFQDYKDLVCKNGGKNVDINFCYAGSNINKIYTAVEKRHMIIAIANNTQLKKLGKVLVPGTRYVTLIDESDAITYGDESSSFRKTLQQMVLENSGRTYNITGTALRIIFMDDTIKGSQVVMMETSNNYRGFKHVQIYKLLDSIKPITDNIESDTCLPKLLKLLSEQDVQFNVKNDVFSLANVEHPMIMLISVSHLIEKQMQLANFVGDIGNWTETIVFNGGPSITIQSKYLKFLVHICRKMTRKSVRTGVNLGRKMLCKNGNKATVVFEKEDMDKALAEGGKPCIVIEEGIDFGLQLFRNLHLDGKKISHLCIIADVMADRCISYVSRDGKWHLTAQYYVPSIGTEMDNAIQRVCRLCGNFNDNLQTRLYTTGKMCDDLALADNLQDELVTDVCQFGDMSLVERMKERLVSNIKIPNRSLCRVKPPFTVVEGSDGGRSRASYRRVLEKINQDFLEGQENVYDEKHDDEEHYTEVVQRSKLVPKDRELFDSIYNYIKDNKLEGQWIDASKGYRKGKPDSQTVFHWLNKEGHEEEGVFLFIRKHKDKKQVKLGNK